MSLPPGPLTCPVCGVPSPAKNPVEAFCINPECAVFSWEHSGAASRLVTIGQAPGGPAGNVCPVCRVESSFALDHQAFCSNDEGCTMFVWNPLENPVRILKNAGTVRLPPREAFG